MSLYRKSVVSALLFACSVLASPVSPSTSSSSELTQLSESVVVNCTDIDAPADPVCWDTLRISDYLTSWQRSTPDCAVTGGSGSDCCGYTREIPETWSSCYLRLAIGGAGYNCDTSTRAAFCNISPLRANENLDPDIQARARYVITAIQAVYDLFASYGQGGRPFNLMFSLRIASMLL